MEVHRISTLGGNIRGNRCVGSRLHFDTRAKASEICVHAISGAIAFVIRHALSYTTALRQSKRDWVLPETHKIGDEAFVAKVGMMADLVLELPRLSLDQALLEVQ